jgi:hypothetical protein
MSQATVLALLAIAISTASLINSYRSKENSREFQLINSTLSHNKMISDDTHRSIACCYLIGSVTKEIEKFACGLHSEDNGSAKLFLATQAVLFSHFNLLYQVWRLSFRREFILRWQYPGWHDLAQKVSLHMYGPSHQLDNLPDWYKSACRNTSLDADVLGQDFVNYLKRACIPA